MGYQRHFWKLDDARVPAGFVYAFFAWSADGVDFLALVDVFALLGVQVLLEAGGANFLRHFVYAREVAFGVQADLRFAVAIVLGGHTLVYICRRQGSQEFSGLKESKLPSQLPVAGLKWKPGGHCGASSPSQVKEPMVFTQTFGRGQESPITHSSISAIDIYLENHQARIFQPTIANHVVSVERIAFRAFL